MAFPFQESTTSVGEVAGRGEREKGMVSGLMMIPCVCPASTTWQHLTRKKKKVRLERSSGKKVKQGMAWREEGAGAEKVISF